MIPFHDPYSAYHEQHRIAAEREHQRVLREEAGRREAERAKTNAALQAALNARRAAHAEAENAAVRAGAVLTSALRMHIAHVVELALVEPAITIVWFGPASRAASLTSGLSLLGSRRIVTPAIRTREDVCIALHELGHLRTNPQGKLESEIRAWRWAMDAALVWERRDHDWMREAICTYAKAATVQDIVGIIAIEEFVSDETFRHYAKPETPAMVEGFEDRFFQSIHGTRPCESGACPTPDAPAVLIDGARFVCRACGRRRLAERAIKTFVASRRLTPRSQLRRQPFTRRRLETLRRRLVARHVAVDPRALDHEVARQRAQVRAMRGGRARRWE